MFADAHTSEENSIVAVFRIHFADFPYACGNVSFVEDPVISVLNVTFKSNRNQTSNSELSEH